MLDSYYHYKFQERLGLILKIQLALFVCLANNTQLCGMSKTSEINFRIHLDADNIPEKIEWRADDAEEKNWKENQAIMLSIWDAEQQNALRIDLWTKDLRVDEMNYFMFQTIMTMADTYEGATQNEELARKMRGFAEYFAEKAEVFKKSGDTATDQPHTH
jgi:gliding motility-associated protein GldC